MKAAKDIDYAITDGMRPLGRVVSKGGKFEPSTPDGRRLDLCETLKDARRAVFQADVDQREIDRLNDDGAPVP